MNIIKAKVNFEKRTISLKGVDLTTGDYNSTKIEFEFDTDDGTKILEIKNPSDELIYSDAIINNEAVLVGKQQITDVSGDKIYYKYSKDGITYWYDKENDKLYQQSGYLRIEVPEFDLDEYTKEYKDASLFTEPGKYIVEISLYGEDSKLSSASDSLKVLPEQVLTDTEEVEGYIPLFDGLMNQLVAAMNEAGNLNITMSKTGSITTIVLTNKDGTDTTVTIPDGLDAKINGYNILTIAAGSNIELSQEGSTLTISNTYAYDDTDVKADIADLQANKITKDANNLTYYTLATNTGSTIELGINTSTYVMTLNLKNSAGTTISTQSIDLPLETMVVGASYDSTTKEIVLVLKNGTEVRFSVADLVSGLVSTEELEDNYYNKTQTDTLLSNKVGFTDYASSSVGGVIKVSTFRGLQMSSGNLQSVVKTYEQYTNSTQTSDNAFIGKGTLENVITGKELTNKTYVDAENATQDTQIEALQEENNYLNSIIDQLPKVTGEGETVILDDTVNSFLDITLKGNTSQDGTPTPDSPIPVNVVSGDNTIKIEGKNKFPSDIYNQLDISGTAQLQQNGYYKINFPSNKTIMEGQFEENTQYTISASAYGSASGNSGVFGFNYTDGTSETKGINQRTAYNYFITSSANKTIRNIQITYGSANTTYIKNLQLEKGSTATTYDEPYVSSSYQVNLGDIELCKIETYQDYIYKQDGAWYVHKEIGKVVLNGSENYANKNLDDTNFMFSTNKIDGLFNVNKLTVITSNFTYYSSLWTNDIEGIALFNQNTALRMRINKNLLSNITTKQNAETSFKAWLSTHNTNVYYVLATPTTIEITDTTLISQLEILKSAESCKGQTNISSTYESGNAPFIISASALLDLNSLINS